MKVIASSASFNTIVLISILCNCAFYQSNIGGPGSIFNAINFLFAGTLIFLNFRLNPFLLLALVFPLIFILLSVLINREVIDNGGLHTVELIAMSYLLLTLAPFSFNKALLERLVRVYLLIALVLSAGCFVQTVLMGGENSFLANSNFNGNPNSASMFFFSCLVLTLVYVHGRFKWVLAAMFFAFVCSTASRAGFGTSILLLLGFGFFSPRKRRSLIAIISHSRNIRRNVFILLVTLGLIFIIFPNMLNILQARLSIAGFGLESKSATGHGRDEIWKTALEASSSSSKTILFGISHSRVNDVIGSGTHSSYVEALLSLGWPFLIFTLLFIGCVGYYHYCRGQNHFLFLSAVILIYGSFETFLFNGLNMLWWIFIFLSLYYRSLEQRKELFSKC